METDDQHTPESPDDSTPPSTERPLRLIRTAKQPVDPPTLARAIDPLLQRAAANARERTTFPSDAEAAERNRQTLKDANRLSGDLGLRYSRTRCSLESYRVYDPAQKPVLERLHRIIPTIADFASKGGGLLFFGPVGTGKDHLLAAMLHAAAAEGVVCRWVNGQEVFGAFRDRIDSGKRDEDHFREMVEPTVLGISDPLPPVGHLGAWDTANLYRLLDRRYRALRPTWVTINVSKPEEADAALSSPVFDRLQDNAELIPCFWPSHRKPRGV